MLIHGAQALFWVARMQHTMGMCGLIPLVISRCFITVIQLDLFEDQLLVLWDLQTEKLEIKIEIADRVASWLIIFKVKSFHVRVRESLINRDATVWVECQHLFDQVDGLVVRPSE